MRIQTAEDERKKAIEKDERLRKDLHELTEKLETSESQVEELEQTVTTLSALVETDKAARKELEERVQQLILEKEELNKKEIKDQEGLKNQYQRLMKERLNEERKQYELKLKAATAAVQEVEEHTPIINRVTSTASVSSRSSFDSNSTAPAIVSSILTERLQANIRQLENQISFYQTQLSSSTQSRDELSEEVVAMTQEIEQLRKESKKRLDLDKEYKDLDGRYQTLLELLGERTEQVEELKADLQDVKEMYKSQIIELLQKQ
jgi:predicted RNase H-like nuclease (RuvC/YqgF family)